MEISRLRNLIREYHAARKKLEEVKGKYEVTKTSYELAIDLEKELNDEIKIAQEGKRAEMEKYWRDILQEHFEKDKDLARKEDFEKCEKEILQKNEKSISYCEKKIKIIKKHLGARLSQLLENYEERNILMGEQYSSQKSANALYEEDEKKLEEIEKERKTRATFDKM